MSQITKETVTISLPVESGTEAREQRMVYAAPATPDGTDYDQMIGVLVDTPRVLEKDNEYRQGATLASIDVAPLRFYGWVKQALEAVRPTRFGWDVWEEPQQ